MSLTRRRLFTGMIETPRQGEWISARGREAAMAGHADAQTGTPVTRAIRISSNENPLGPGQHVVDAIVGKFPEAARYPFNATQKEGALIAALAQKFSAKTDNIVLGPGSGELLTHAVRAFTSPTKPLVTAWPSFENPRDVAKKIGTAGPRGGLRRQAADRHRQDGRGLEGRRPGVLLQPEQPDRDRARQDRRGRHGQGDPRRLARHGDPHRRGVPRLRDRPVLPVGDRRGAGDAQRVRDPHLLEGLRHGRAARRLRHRPRADDQGDHRLQDALRAGHADPGRRDRRAGQPAAHRRRAQAQHRGAGVHGEGVRRHGRHRHRLADQLRVHGHQAAGRRLPRRLPRRRRLRRPRLPAVPEHATAASRSARWTRCSAPWPCSRPSWAVRPAPPGRRGANRVEGQGGFRHVAVATFVRAHDGRRRGRAVDRRAGPRGLALRRDAAGAGADPVGDPVEQREPARLPQGRARRRARAR